MRVDVSAFVGSYPWRRVPGTSPEALLGAMDRTGVDTAWVTHLPGLFWRDPTEGNPWLLDVTRGAPRLLPVPTVHPALAHWAEVLDLALAIGAPAVRADPMRFGLDPAGAGMQALAGACGDAGVALLLGVQLEDGRQRHPLDRAEDLPAAAVRALVRVHPKLRLVVTHADRSYVEEVHFGSTPEEAARIWWDICRIWGPPEDHLETLLSTIGPQRFVFGTGQPLRLPESAVAKLDLLDLEPADRTALESGNAALVC